MSIQRIIFIEPRAEHLNVFSRYNLPRLGCTLLATILKEKGYDASVLFVHEKEVYKINPDCDLAAISTITPSFPNTVIDMPNFATDSAAGIAPPARAAPRKPRREMLLVLFIFVLHEAHGGSSYPSSCKVLRGMGRARRDLFDFVDTIRCLMHNWRSLMRRS